MDEGDFYILEENCKSSIESILKYLKNQKEEKFLYELKAYIDETKER